MKRTIDTKCSNCSYTGLGVKQAFCNDRLCVECFKLRYYPAPIVNAPSHPYEGRDYDSDEDDPGNPVMKAYEELVEAVKWANLERYVELARCPVCWKNGNEPVNEAAPVVKRVKQ